MDEPHVAHEPILDEFYGSPTCVQRLAARLVVAVHLVQDRPTVVLYAHTACKTTRWFDLNL